MADILLSFGVATSEADVSEIRKGLDQIIKKIEKNPPKIRVGLTIDDAAIKNFKQQLETVLNTVGLANGAPITLNISGLGEISSQASQAADSVKKMANSTRQYSSAIAPVLNSYREMHALMRKNKNATDQTTEAFVGIRAQADLFKNALELARRESTTIDVAFAKMGTSVGVAIQNATNAMAMFRAEMEHTGQSGTVTSRQLYDVVYQMQSLLDTNKNAGNLTTYTKLNSQFVKLYEVMKLVRDSGDSVEDAMQKIGVDGSNAIDAAKTAMSAFKTELAGVSNVTGTQLIKAFRQMKHLIGSNENASGLGTYKQLEAQIDIFEQKIIDSNGSIRSAESVLAEFGNTAATELTNATNAMAMFRAEMEHTGQSGTAVKMLAKNTTEYSAALRQTEKLLAQVEDRQENWTKAKKGVSKDDYEKLEQYREALNALIVDLQKVNMSPDDFKKRITQIQSDLSRTEGSIKRVGEDTKSLSDRLKGLAEKFGIWLTISQVIMMAVRAMKKMVSAVIEVDRAMTELKKVTNETSEVYDRFLTNASRRAKQLGASVSDVVNATADFARLGYNIEDASSLADAALIYKNIGDGIEDITEASESLISTMQAFGIEASNALSIIDKFNEVGNNFAISSAGIGEALQRSAASMAAANNTLEETIALATAANTIVQNPETVGTTLKTISMYLRAARTEAEETGETTEGMAGSLSELRSEILSLTGQKVDIQIDANTFKSTYQILKELSLVWDELSDVSQANILELVGGKRNANVVAALLDNFSVAENALATANEASGSAMKENEKHLDSIQGKLDQFKSAFEAFSNSFIESDVVKFFVDAGTTILNILNSISSQCGITEIAITGLFMALARSNRIGNMFIEKTYTATSGEKGIFETFAMNNKMGIKQSAGEVLQLAKNTGVATENVKAFLLAEKTGPKTLANFEKWMSSQNGQTIKLSKSFKNLWSSAKKTFESMSAYIVMLNAVRAVSDIFDLIKSMSEPAKSIQEQFDELSSELSSVNSELSSLESELQNVENQIESILDHGELSFTDSEELARLQNVSRELENQIALTKTLQENLDKNLSEVALSAYSDYASGTSFYSDKSKSERIEEAKSIGSTIGNVAGLIIGSLVTKNPIVGAAAGSSIGTWLGGEAGGTIGANLYVSELSVEDALDKMVYERARLEELQNSAYATYSNDQTPDNKKRWQDAAQSLSDYNSALSTHIQQLVEYKNAVNYSLLSTDAQREQYRAIGDDIDRYNIMMGAQGSIYASLDRMFSEKEITGDMEKLRNIVRTALSVAGDDMVFSYDLELDGCEKAVSRLMSVGVTVEHVIAYFEDLEKAESEAFKTSTYDIVEDIAELSYSINDLVDAFREFNEEGVVTAETLTKLNSTFGMLGDAWDRYVDTMTNGDSTIQDAVNATNDLAEARILSLFNSGGIRLNKQVTNSDGSTSWVRDEEQYQAYLAQISYLEAINITNAKELIDAMQQQAMIAEVIAQKKADAVELETLREKKSLTSAEAERKRILEGRTDQYYIDIVEMQYGMSIIDTSLVSQAQELNEAKQAATDYADALTRLTSGESDFLRQFNSNILMRDSLIPLLNDVSGKISDLEDKGYYTSGGSLKELGSAIAEVPDMLGNLFSGQNAFTGTSNMIDTAYDEYDRLSEAYDGYSAQVSELTGKNMDLFYTMVGMARDLGISLGDIDLFEFDPYESGENSVFYQVYQKLKEALENGNYEDIAEELETVLANGLNKVGLRPHLDLNLDEFIINGLDSGYKLAQTAAEEMELNGEISINTLQSLAAASEDYLDYLYLENGQLKINLELWNQSYVDKATENLGALQKKLSDLENERDDLLLNRSTAEEFGDTDAVSYYTEKLEENSLATQDVQHDIEMLSHIFDDFTDKIDGTANSVDNLSNRLTHMSNVESLSVGFDMINDIYNDMIDGGEFDWGRILNNQEFVDTFGRLGEEYDAFISAMMDNPDGVINDSSIDALKGLIRAYIEYSGVLDNVRSATQEWTIAYLESLGVANAEAVVRDARNETFFEYLQRSEECADMTYEEVMAMAEACEAGSLLRQVYLEIAAEKIRLGIISVDTESDIRNLLNLAKTAGATTETIQELERVLSFFEKYTNYRNLSEIFADDPELSANYAELAESYRQNAYDAAREFELDFEMLINFGVESDTDEDTWFEKQYKEHKHLVAMDRQTDIEYFDWLNDAYKKAYKENIITLDEYYKYQEEVYQGVLDLFKDHISDIDHDISIFGSDEGSSDKVIALHQRAINDINQMLAKARALGLDENGDYIQYLEKQLKDHSDAIVDLREQAETEIKDSIDQLVKYRVDMLKQEINDEKDALNEKLDALKEFYDKQREMLQDQHDEEKYLEEQAEKRKTVTELKEELDWIALNDSAWAQRRKHELQEQLAEAEKELADFEKDHALDITLDMLDEQQSQQEEQIQAEIDALDELLNDPHSLFNQSLADIKGNTAALYNGFIEYNRKHGSGNDQDIIDMWEGAYNADQEYQDTHNGQHKDDIVIGNYTGYAPDVIPTSPNSTTSNSTGSAGNPGSVSNLSQTLTYGSKGEGVKALQRALNALGFGNAGTASVDGSFGNQTAAAVRAYQTSRGVTPTGNVGPKTKLALSKDGYASGTVNATPGAHEVDELGPEYLFISPSDGSRYRIFTGGEKVLNAEATNFLYDFATSGGGIITKMLSDLFGLNNFGGITRPVQAIELHAGDIIVQGNATERTVSEIRRAQREHLDFVIREFNKLNK